MMCFIHFPWTPPWLILKLLGPTVCHSNTWKGNYTHPMEQYILKACQRQYRDFVGKHFSHPLMRCPHRTRRREGYLETALHYCCCHCCCCCPWWRWSSPTLSWEKQYFTGDETQVLRNNTGSAIGPKKTVAKLDYSNTRLTKKIA